MSETLPSSLALDLARVTEAGAIAAARWLGRGDKNLADKAAVDAMRDALERCPISGVVVIGEGEKDEAPMLYIGEEVGSGGPAVDIAVDPLEGTTLTAKGQPNALATFAIAPRGTMFNPGPAVYMEKLAGGPAIADLLTLDAPIEELLDAVAKRRGCQVRDIGVVVLDRDRHMDQIGRMRAAGARVRLIPDGDVAGSLMAVRPGTGIDLLWGVGGTPEGVLSASAIRSVGGRIIGRLWPRTDEEAAAITAAGLDLQRILDTDDLVGSQDTYFAATGVSDGDLVSGVRFFDDHAETDTLVLRGACGTQRVISSSIQAEARLKHIPGSGY
ncbi:MAG: class II fructose-bisphosphatase [Actinobacteria bacterium]|nr:class II fructose-bisphosphatase [Actinomycetota bacterium]